MEIADILIPEGVLPHLKVTSKKQALQELSRRAADVTGLEQREIFDVLLEREHLKALARVSRLLRDKAVCEKIRGADSVDAIYALLTEAKASNAA